jgi:acyl transferase domain-containing protein
LLTVVGETWTAGINIDWESFYANETRNKLHLPTYSFTKTEYPVVVNAFRMLSEMLPERKDSKCSNTDEWFYAPTWKLSRVAENGREGTRGTVAFFCQNAESDTAIQAALETAGENIVRIIPGESFKKITDNHYEINPSGETGYAAIADTLKAPAQKIKTIIYAWAPRNSREMYSGHSNEMDLAFYGLVKLVKALSKTGSLQGVRLVLLTQGLHQVLDNAPQGLLQALPAGLLKVLALEFPSLKTCHADTDAETAGNKIMLDALCADILADHHGYVLAYRKR